MAGRQVRRGTNAQRVALGGASVAEFIFETDTKDIYIGASGGDQLVSDASAWVHLGGQDQAVKKTSSPEFAGLTVNDEKGLKGAIPSLAEGKQYLCTDTRELYVGSSVGNIRVGDTYTTPEQYGANGDGTFDNSAALLNTYNSLAGTGGRIILGTNRTYRYTTPLVIAKHGVIIEGQGRAASTLFFDNDTDVAITFQGGISTGGLKHFLIHGPTTRSAGTGIIFRNIDGWVLEDITTQNLWNGLIFDNANTGYAKGVEVGEFTVGTSQIGFNIYGCVANNFKYCGVNCNNVGFYVLGGGNDTLVFDHCWVQKTPTAIPGDGWNFSVFDATEPPRWVRLISCFTEVGDAAIGYDIANAYGIMMTNCFNSWGKNGISVGAATHDVKIDGGEYMLSKEHGIILNGCRDIGMSGVIVSDNSQSSDGGFDGIIIVDGTTHVRITGCRAGHSIWGGTDPSAGIYQNRGINIAAGNADDYIVIVGNDVSGNKQTDGIVLTNTLAGGHNVIAHNVGTTVTI